MTSLDVLYFGTIKQLNIFYCANIDRLIWLTLSDNRRPTSVSIVMVDFIIETLSIIKEQKLDNASYKNDTLFYIKPIPYFLRYLMPLKLLNKLFMNQSNPTTSAHQERERQVQSPW